MSSSELIPQKKQEQVEDVLKLKKEKEILSKLQKTVVTLIDIVVNDTNEKEKEDITAYANQQITEINKQMTEIEQQMNKIEQKMTEINKQMIDFNK